MSELADSSTGGGREALVVFNDDRAAEAFRNANTNYKVRQIASPRVCVVECSPGELKQLESLPGATVVSGADLPHEIGNSLNETEALFVSAWQSRIKGPAKQRAGEGLNWDTPGFEPPDPPKGVTGPDKKSK